MSSGTNRTFNCTHIVIPTVMPPVGRGVLYANNCAWATILVANGTWLNASVTASASGQELVLSAAVPHGMSADQATPVGSSYPWGSVPMMNAYDRGSALPVLPWTTNPQNGSQMFPPCIRTKICSC